MTTTIHIKGMSCNHCVQAVSKALQSLPGLKNVEVNLNTGTAVLEHTESLDMNAVRDKIEKAGYELA
jgi:copper chaperone|uniref:Copper chaperone n=1 Tax=Desulfomonile tiedjei TaxID=2358 RepID=A0A7C4ES18_9BACT